MNGDLPVDRRADPRPRDAILASASEVSLACHVSPDGDALGSMLALHHVLRRGRDPRASRRSRSRSSSRRTTASCPGSSCSRRPTSSRASRSVMVTFDSRFARPPRRSRAVGQGRGRARRHRPSRVEPALRHHQRDRSRRGRAAVCSCARLIDRLGLAAHPRRGGVPLRRARLRHRPVPVRVDDAGRLRARA